MVAQITLNIRHIRGHTFTVEVDHDAETLGLKVIIWEAQHIVIDQQRLVFAGKELEDGSKLSDSGIIDGAQIFLIESGDAAAAAPGGDVVAQVSVSEVQASAVVPPAFSVESAAGPRESGSFAHAVNMPAPHSSYELVSEDQGSLERINAAICLAKYVRVYCILGFILSLLSSTFGGVWCAAVVALIYLLGWIGTRQLNRCLLVFPMMLTFLLGFGGIVLSVCFAVTWGNEMEGDEWLMGAIFLFVSFLHVMICFSIGKLCSRIRRLSCDEWSNARAKIRSRGCCC